MTSHLAEPISAELYDKSMDGGAIDKRQPQRPLLDIDAINSGENDAMFDAMRIFDTNLIVR